MVSYIYVGVSAAFGFCAYLIIPFVAASLGSTLRHKIAQTYWKLMARSMGAMVIVRRTIGKHQLKQMQFDDEKAAAKVVLDDSFFGDSKPLHFNDPDDRSHRLNRKQMAIIHEGVNGAIDPKLCEIGHYWRQHRADGGARVGEQLNPHFEVSRDRRVGNIDDALPLILSDTEPQDVQTMTDYTKHRFAKYAGNLDAMDGLIGVIGGGVGFAMPMIAQYVQVKIIGDGGGDPSTTVPVSTLVPVDTLTDLSLALAGPATDLLTVIA